MNRIIGIELLEEHDHVTFYTIRYIGEQFTEFDKFYDRFDNQTKYERDLNNTVTWIDKIGKTGALDRNFRPERGDLKALPTDFGKLRLYCFRLTEGIVLLGNGGIKTTRTFNEDPVLNEYAETIESVGKILLSRINNGHSTNTHNNLLHGSLTVTLK